MSFLGFWSDHYRDIPRVRQILLVRRATGSATSSSRPVCSASCHSAGAWSRSGNSRCPAIGLSAPGRLRSMFEELGPTFIKLGQVLACRPDLLPLEYAKELAGLTDSVAPFPFAEARDIIEKDLGAPLGSLFASFEPKPIAAASIAQVHQAVLPDGREVMVKVQRPNIEENITRDISILRGIAQLIDTHVPRAPALQRSGHRGGVQPHHQQGTRFLHRGVQRRPAQEQFHPKARSCTSPRSMPNCQAARAGAQRIDGVRIDDYAGIERMGFDRKDIALRAPVLSSRWSCRMVVPRGSTPRQYLRPRRRQARSRGLRHHGPCDRGEP